MVRLKFLIPFLLCVLVTAVTGFSKSENAKKETKNPSGKFDPPFVYLFSYTGPEFPVDFNDYVDIENYVILPDGTQPPDVCGWYGTEAVCAIFCERYWDGLQWKPDFSKTSWGSAYWGLYNFYMSGLPATGSVVLKDL